MEFDGSHQERVDERGTQTFLEWTSLFHQCVRTTKALVIDCCVFCESNNVPLFCHVIDGTCGSTSVRHCWQEPKDRFDEAKKEKEKKYGLENCVSPTKRHGAITSVREKGNMTAEVVVKNVMVCLSSIWVGARRSLGRSPASFGAGRGRPHVLHL